MVKISVSLNIYELISVVYLEGHKAEDGKYKNLLPTYVTEDTTW